MTIILRLAEPIDYAVRAAMLEGGEMSAVITDAMHNVDLKAVKLLGRQEEHDFSSFKSTTVNVQSQVHRMMKEAATNRGCSMNLLVNSALAQYLKPFMKSDFRDLIRQTWAKVRQQQR